MSKFINNREYRQSVLKELISELHRGASVEDVKAKFEETFGSVSTAEIAEVEQALIGEGMPVAEVQRLCDVHAAVFKGSIEDIHREGTGFDAPGHPLHTLLKENEAIGELIRELLPEHLYAYAADGSEDVREALKEDLALLGQIDLHYLKKENLLFPYLEKYGVTAPPKVMWGVDDEIRSLIKSAAAALSEADREETKRRAEEAVEKIGEMIFKEENILFPMLRETLTPDEWKRIADEYEGIGYCLIHDVPAWHPTPVAAVPVKEAREEDGVVFPTGVLKKEELVRLLDTLLFDITFVDKDGTVKYFSQAADRIFPRTKAVIGRKVSNCHPPASVQIVEKLVAQFQSGEKDHEDFWIPMGEKYVLIRYFAVRDEQGKFLGTLEVTQDIAPIQKITGEKRLAD